jgi:ribose 5-phosphate isomerase A
VADPRATAKASAAVAGARCIGPGLRVALGTGTTSSLALEALRDRVGELRGTEFVASSLATEQLAAELGLRVRPLRGDDRFDIMVDGADEVDPSLNLTKGGGGALFREKLLARLSREVVILVDATKLVPRLGVSFPIPVEVVPFATPLLVDRLAHEGAVVRARAGADGGPYRTDNANAILDVAWPGGVADVAGTEAALRALPGVVEVGLFVGLADRVLVGRSDGSVEELRRPPSTRRG